MYLQDPLNEISPVCKKESTMLESQPTTEISIDSQIEELFFFENDFMKNIVEIWEQRIKTLGLRHI